MSLKQLLFLFVIHFGLINHCYSQQDLKMIKSYSRNGQNSTVQKLVILEKGNYIDNTGAHFQNVTDKILEMVTKLVETSKTEKQHMGMLLNNTKEILTKETNIIKAISEIKTGLNNPVDSFKYNPDSEKKLQELFTETELVSQIAEVEKMGSSFYVNSFKLLSDQSIIFKSDFKQTHLIAVKKHNAYGYCDSTGKLTIDYQFDEATNFENGIAIVKKNGNWYFIDKKGISIKNLGVGTKFYGLYNGYTLANVPDKDLGKTPVLRIVDTSGSHNYLMERQNFAAKNLVDCKFGKIIIRVKDNEYAICNHKGEKITTLSYYSVSPMSDKGISIISHNGLMGYYDILNDKLISDLRYKSAEPFNYSSAIVIDKNGNFGLINTNNFTLIEFGMYNVSRHGNSDFLKFERLDNKKRRKKNTFITTETLSCVSGECDLK